MATLQVTNLTLRSDLMGVSVIRSLWPVVLILDLQVPILESVPLIAILVVLSWRQVILACLPRWEHLEERPVQLPRKCQATQVPIVAPLQMEVALSLNTLLIQHIRPLQLVQVEFRILLTPILLLDSPVKILTKTGHLPILIISNLFLSLSIFA